jgi:flagellar FliL protein
MADKKEEKKGKAKKKESSKGAAIGKIFLLVAILAVQGILAYKLVAANYEGIYKSMNAEEPDDIGYFDLEPLVVNPAKTNGKRYLMVEISLELKNKEHIPILEANSMKIQESMIEALSSKTVGQLVNAEIRMNLREELSGIINETIGEPSVRNLYFTKYVMQ